MQPAYERGNDEILTRGERELAPKGQGARARPGQPHIRPPPQKRGHADYYVPDLKPRLTHLGLNLVLHASCSKPPGCVVVVVVAARVISVGRHVCNASPYGGTWHMCNVDGSWPGGGRRVCATLLLPSSPSARLHYCITIRGTGQLLRVATHAPLPFALSQGASLDPGFVFIPPYDQPRCPSASPPRPCWRLRAGSSTSHLIMGDHAPGRRNEDIFSVLDAGTNLLDLEQLGSLPLLDFQVPLLPPPLPPLLVTAMQPLRVGWLPQSCWTQPTHPPRPPGPGTLALPCPPPSHTHTHSVGRPSPIPQRAHACLAPALLLVSCPRAPGPGRPAGGRRARPAGRRGPPGVGRHAPSASAHWTVRRLLRRLLWRAGRRDRRGRQRRVSASPGGPQRTGGWGGVRGRASRLQPPGGAGGGLRNSPGHGKDGGVGGWGGGRTACHRPESLGAGRVGAEAPILGTVKRS